jgi:Holliday junction resolvase
MMPQGSYQYGRAPGKAVAGLLRRQGYDVELASGSRGACDIWANKGRDRLCIQVKSTRDPDASRWPLPADEDAALRQRARRTGRTPVLAWVKAADLNFMRLGK